MLYEPERHEPLRDAWDANRAQAAIRDIVADSERAMQPDLAWPWHPLDEDGAPEPAHQSAYLGAAGVLWALWALRRSGTATLRTRPEEAMGALHEAYLARPDTGAVVPSLFLGEVGILLLQWRATGTADLQRLAHAIAGNARNPTLEALWGAPGTMLAALHLHAATGDEAWADLYRDSAFALWEAWLPSGGMPCRLWTQDLYGRVEPILGAGHGFAGNAFALLRGAHLLPEAMRAELFARCAETVSATASVEDGMANWAAAPPGPGRPLPRMLVQWCHGAPGMITSLATMPPGLSQAVDALLFQAGELTWRAGPLAKGPGLCHGTAGNGYAFLALHRRTGDALWLSRARAFAAHAIVQVEAARAACGRGRYSLWTGDPGVALYLRDCIAGRSSGLPMLDTLE